LISVSDRYAIAWTNLELKNKVLIRVTIFLLVTCAALLSGFLPSPKFIFYIIQHTGYYFIFVSFFLWVAWLFKIYFTRLKAIFRKHYGGFLLSALLMVLIFFIAPPKFKILSDETNLIGISMAMYQSKEAYLPIQGFKLDYGEPEYKITVGKRPLLYPLLVSFAHGLLGYSAYNGFVVNFFCGIMVLLLIYLFIYDHFPRIYALLSIVMVASLPNFVIWVTSSGFETLNLFFIIFTIFIFSKVIAHRDVKQAELLFLTLVLVAQCRYESIAFTVASLFVLPILLNKKAIAEFSIITYLIPILFIPTIWLPRLYAGIPVVNKVGSDIVQTANLYDAFSFANLISNTPKNLMVFLGFDPNLGFSPVISMLSVAGIYLMTKKLISGNHNKGRQFRTLWFFGAVTAGLLYIIQVSFYLGDMAIYTQNRFAMAYLPYMIVPAIFCIHEILKDSTVARKVFVAVFFVFHLLFFWPYASQQLLVNTGSLPYEYNKTLRYLEEKLDNNHNILVISERPNLYLVHYAGAVDFAYANQNPEKILVQCQREFDHIIVLQRCRYKTRAPLVSNRLRNSYQMKSLGYINLTRSEYLSVSELTEKG
jgi:hypothetical protein